MSMLVLTLGKIGMNILMSMLTEGLIKNLLIHALEAIAKKTSNDLDDKLIGDVKQALGVK